VDLLNLAATIPVRTEVERALDTSFRVMRSAQNSQLILKSHKDVAATRSERIRNHIRAKTDERFRTELVPAVFQYVSSALQSAALVGALSGADKQRGTVAIRFHANLVWWVQTHFLPFVRERLPSCMLSPLLTAAYDWGGQLQTTEPLLDAASADSETGVGASMLSTARQQQRSVPAIGVGHQRSVPIARRLALEEFQHLHNRCETCARECKSARSRFVCSCGAICCKACYGLKGFDANDAGYQCDACREEHKGAAVVHPREDFYFCHACTAELPPRPSLAIQSWCPDCRFPGVPLPWNFSCSPTVHAIAPTLFAQHIEQLFEGRLVLFTAETPAKTKYASIVEKELHALVALTGWTHGHIAEVIAAVGSGPSPLVVFNWLGWAGLLFMREAVHFKIVGSHALSPRQKLEFEQFRERVAVVSCYQPAQGRWSHPQLDREWTRAVFNLPAAVKHFIFFFIGSMNRILEETFYMWLDILNRVVGSCLLLLNRPKGMRTRIKNWIWKYIATANPDFDPSRVLFRPFQNKVHFCGLIRAMLEDGAGACLDTVEPITLHTSADDVFGNGSAVLTYLCDNGFQQRIVYELHFEYGTNELCVAKSRSEFPDLCVRYALDKPLQRAMRQYFLRVNEERVQDAKLARQLLRVFD
jgi:hypothetical protein